MNERSNYERLTIPTVWIEITIVTAMSAIDMAVVALPVFGDWIRSVELFWEPMFVVLPAGHRSRIGMRPVCTP